MENATVGINNLRNAFDENKKDQYLKRKETRKRKSSLRLLQMCIIVVPCQNKKVKSHALMCSFQLCSINSVVLSVRRKLL